MLIFDGRWNTVKEWHDLLSLGEQQRLSVIRLLFHKPVCDKLLSVPCLPLLTGSLQVLAILDEATSALSTDIEEEVYKLLIQV